MAVLQTKIEAKSLSGCLIHRQRDALNHPPRDAILSASSGPRAVRAVSVSEKKQEKAKQRTRAVRYKSKEIPQLKKILYKRGLAGQTCPRYANFKSSRTQICCF